VRRVLDIVLIGCVVMTTLTVLGIVALTMFLKMVVPVVAALIVLRAVLRLVTGGSRPADCHESHRGGRPSGMSGLIRMLLGFR